MWIFHYLHPLYPQDSQGHWCHPQDQKSVWGYVEYQSNQKSDFYGTGSLAHGKSATTTSKAYYKLDEDGVPLRDMKSDSTEVLHTNDKPNNGIVLTTRITVNTQETHSVSDSDDMHMGAKAAWAR